MKATLSSLVFTIPPGPGILCRTEHGWASVAYCPEPSRACHRVSILLEDGKTRYGMVADQVMFDSRGFTDPTRFILGAHMAMEAVLDPENWAGWR